MFRPSRSSSGVHFIQKLKTHDKIVNFCEISQIIQNIIYNRLVIRDGVSFNTNDMVYNFKLKNLKKNFRILVPN